MRALNDVASRDNKLSDLEITYVSKEKDPNHVQRRKQSRAISDEMIKIAVVYGHKSWSRGARAFSLSDKQVKDTQYEKYSDKLRGLRVIATRNKEEINIITVCWEI